MPDIIRVTSLSNYSWVHAEGDDILVDPFFPDDIELTQELMDSRKDIAMNHEVLPDYLISKNANTEPVRVIDSISPEQNTLDCMYCD